MARVISDVNWQAIQEVLRLKAGLPRFAQLMDDESIKVEEVDAETLMGVEEDHEIVWRRVKDGSSQDG